MNSIIDGNEEIVNNIREIYTTASADKLRSLIEKHFIPTADEKKKNAEVPTPVKLVDEMLEKIPAEFWTTPKRVFEPCCGKGNFVLGIFDKFYNDVIEIGGIPRKTRFWIGTITDDSRRHIIYIIYIDYTVKYNQ
jgi:hypothetical protein